MGQRQKTWVVYLIIGLSVVVKAFFFIFNRGVIGPDAIEYIAAADIIRDKGFFAYLSDLSPYTLWRLPFLPLLLASARSLEVFYALQLLLSYVLSYYIFLIFNQTGFPGAVFKKEPDSVPEERLSLRTPRTQLAAAVGLFSLFIPYLNIAACSPEVEFMHVFLMVYLTLKVVKNQTDGWMALALSLLCLLRAEGFTVVLMLLALNIFLRNYRSSGWLAIPLCCTAIWMLRNFLVFGTFSLVNPIMASRALIGSIYGVLYVEEAHPFHQKYNYYEGFDYVNRKDFVSQYKQVVSQELSQYIIHKPMAYIVGRMYWVSKCFSYISLHGEHLPDENWHFSTTTDWKTVVATNSQWSYVYLLAKKEYFRLLLRVAYNIGLSLGHFTGLLYLCLNLRRFWGIGFMMLTFSYVFIVEADMRYLIYPQLICLCIAFMMIFSLIFPKILIPMERKIAL